MPRWESKTTLERLLEKVKEELDCWIYQGAIDREGYGKFRIKINGKWTVRKAHQVSYELHYGKCPEGQVVRHKCDERACINPNHLEPGSQRDNVMDIIKRNRGANQYGPWVGKQYVADQTDDVPF